MAVPREISIKIIALLIFYATLKGLVLIFPVTFLGMIFSDFLVMIFSGCTVLVSFYLYCCVMHVICYLIYFPESNQDSGV